MIITEDTRLREMRQIEPLLRLSGVDLLKECERFPVPAHILGIKPVDFDAISFNDLIYFWDERTPDEWILAICEVFFYPNLSKIQRFFNQNPEKWAKKWVINASLIDFYRFTAEIVRLTRETAEKFKSQSIPLSQEEIDAGYGAPDPHSKLKILDAFARRQGISDIEEAGKMAWTKVYFSILVDVEDAKKQRKYNKILMKKQQQR